MVFSLSSFPFVFFVPNTMEDVHVFEGVAYVPIKFIRDKQRDWVSAGWLSKQMAHMGYMKIKPTSIGLSVESGIGHRSGDYMRLDQAIQCIPVKKQPEARKYFKDVLPGAGTSHQTECTTNC